MRVLMATDGSKEAGTAIRSACRFLKREGLEVELVCVTPEFQPAATGWDSSRVREKYERKMTAEAQRVLGEAKRMLEEEGIAAAALSKAGPAAGVLVEMAGDYDLLVIGAKGRETPYDVGLGTTANRIVEHAPGAVLVGRELLSDSGFRALVAVDGSEASTAAVEKLSALFQLEAVDITLMSVVESPWLYLGLEEEWLDDSKEDEDMPGPEVQWEKEMMREAESAIENARTRLPPGCHASVTPILERGNPAEFILSEAEKGGYDLVVVGATGAADLKHEMLGKVSTKIAWNAPGSVLVARSGG